MTATIENFKKAIYDKMIELNPLPDVQPDKDAIDDLIRQIESTQTPGSTRDDKIADLETKKEQIDSSVESIDAQYSNLALAISTGIVDVIKEKGIEIGDSTATRLDAG